MQANQIETDAPGSLNPGAPAREKLWGAALIALVLVALALRFMGLTEREVHPDEWFHVLTGAAWAQGEGLTYIRGTYDRAWLYTVLVGQSHNLPGLDGFAAGRFPAFLAGVICVVLAYVLGKRTVSNAVGCLTAALVAFDTMMIEWSQISRFYTLQTAAILAVACIAAGPNLRLPAPSWPRFFLAGIAALLLALIAVSVQIISIIALAGIGLYALSRTPWATCEFWSEPSKARVVATGFVIAGAIIAVTGAYLMWPELRATQAWSAADKNNLLYYDDYLRTMYGVLWPLSPVIALVAFKRSRDAVLMAVLVAGPVIAVQSLGGMKAPRYIIQAVPFLALLWAAGLSAAFYWLSELCRDILAGLHNGRNHAGMHRWDRYLAGAVAVAMLAFALGSNQSYRLAFKGAIKDSVAMLEGRELLRTSVLDPVEQGELVKLQEGLRGDAVLASGVTQELAFTGALAHIELSNPLDDAGEPFNYMPRPGVFEIANAKELEMALHCLPKTDVVVAKEEIGTDLLPLDTYGVLTENARKVSHDNGRFELFQAEGSQEIRREAQCAELLDALGLQD